MSTNIFRVFLLMFSVVALGTFALAQKTANPKQLADGTVRVQKAAAVITEIMRVSDRSIPRSLLADAKAIVVFPGALKAAFIFGGQGGQGVVIVRDGRGWTAPAFLNMGGGSFGAQIGGQKTDYVLLVMNDKGLKNLLKDKFEIGAEGSVAAGPVGRTAAASTNITLDAEILSYSRSKGLFAGIALKGVFIAPDVDMNNAIYQKNAREILANPRLASSDAPKTLRKLALTVSVYDK